MSRTDILRKINQAINPDGTSVDFSEFDSQVEALKKKLKDKIQIQTVSDVNAQLDKFRKRIDIQPLVDAVGKIKGDTDRAVEVLNTQIDAKTAELNDLVSRVTDEDKSDDEVRDKALSDEIDGLKTQVDLIKKNRTNDLISLTNQIEKVGKIDGRVTREVAKIDTTIAELNGRIDSDSEDDKKIVTEINKNLENLRKDVYSKLATIGGGSMNRQIKVNGTDVLTKYTDINLTGAITTSENNTNKSVDIAFGSGTGGYVPYTGATTNVDLGAHNLTVDTNTLFVNSVNHRVGIGTTGPSYPLDTVGKIRSYKSDSSGGFIAGTDSTSAVTALDVQYQGFSKAGLYVDFGTQEVRHMAGPTNNSYFQTFYSSGLERMRIAGGGNVGIGTTVDNGILTTAGTIAPSVNNTHSLGTSSFIWSIVHAATLRGGGGVFIIKDSIAGGSNDSFIDISSASNNTHTTGTGNLVNLALGFAPTSGTKVMNYLTIDPTINQTGGANGITRGLYINPTLTAAADFRALDITGGKVLVPTVTHSALTVATLPTGVAGTTAYITDGDAGLAWGATAVNTGAGATPYLVWYNGTNWTVAGK